MLSAASNTDREAPTFRFDAIWKLHTPPRINTFLWRVAHHRLMTNSERHLRGIADLNLCPRCHLYPETVMHVLRDCEITLELWEEIVDPAVWHLFASLGLERWLEFNLKHHRMGASSDHWPILFATMIHLLWIDRNHLVFSGKSALPSLFLPKVLGRVAIAQHYLMKPAPSFIEASFALDVRWAPPSFGGMKLNTDGSRKNGLAACGGLLRNAMGQFISGFHCNLGSATSVLAELWGLTLGLRLARQLGVTRLLVELDSRTVCSMISARRTHCLNLQPVLDEALSLIQQQDWNCSVRHIYREANSCADILANIGHSGSFQWTILQQAPAQINLALQADARGCYFVRIVQ